MFIALSVKTKCEEYMLKTTLEAFTHIRYWELFDLNII